MAGMYLFAMVNFVPGRYDDWQAAYDELAVHVKANEPTTHTYYFGIPFDYQHDPSGTTLMFAFEAYGKKEDLYETHFKSDAMGQFLKKIPPTMSTGLDLMHYAPAAGYIDKYGDSRECGVMQDVRIWCKDSSARKNVLERLSKVAKAVEASDPGVYTFLVTESIDNDHEVRCFNRFKDREAMEKHLRDSEVARFWESSKDDISRMESRGYLPNGKGWLHR